VRCVKEDMSTSKVLLKSRSIVKGIIDLLACNIKVLKKNITYFLACFIVQGLYI